MGTATIARDRVRAPQVRTEVTRSRLIAAAGRIFVRDGFVAASIEEIATRAGYTRGAFYANFESKEALFLTLLEQRFHARLAELRGLLLKLETEPERLRALREHYINRSADRSWALLMLEFKLFAIRNPEARRKAIGAYRQMRRLYRDFIGDLVPIHTPQLSSGVIGASLSALANGLVVESMFDSACLAGADLRQVLGVLFDRILAQG
jgi:AcrR family transcriptional regulator